MHDPHAVTKKLLKKSQELQQTEGSGIDDVSSSLSRKFYGDWVEQVSGFPGDKRPRSGILGPGQQHYPTIVDAITGAKEITKKKLSTHPGEWMFVTVNDVTWRLDSGNWKIDIGPNPTIEEEYEKRQFDVWFLYIPTNDTRPLLEKQFHEERNMGRLYWSFLEIPSVMEPSEYLRLKFYGEWTSSLDKIQLGEETFHSFAAATDKAKELALQTLGDEWQCVAVDRDTISEHQSLSDGAVNYNVWFLYNPDKQDLNRKKFTIQLKQRGLYWSVYDT